MYSIDSLWKWLTDGLSSQTFVSASDASAAAPFFLILSMARVYRIKSLAAISRKTALALSGKVRHDDEILLCACVKEKKTIDHTVSLEDMPREKDKGTGNH